MKDIFSLKRFGLLLRKFTKEHFRTYLLYAGSLFGILFILLGIAVLNVLHWKYQPVVILVIFIFLLIISNSIFNAGFYNFFRNKAKGIQFLQIPASQEEKIALGFLFTQVVFLITFLVLFSVANRLMCDFYNHFHKLPEHVIPEELSEYVANPLRFTDETAKGAIIVSLVFSAIFHYGSLCFEKNAFVKTALAMIITGLAVFYFNFYSMQAMIPEENMPGGKLFNTGIRLGNWPNIKGFISLPDNWYHFMYWFLPGILYTMFWTASYFKLKEKQV